MWVHKISHTHYSKLTIIYARRSPYLEILLWYLYSLPLFSWFSWLVCLACRAHLLECIINCHSTRLDVILGARFPPYTVSLVWFMIISVAHMSITTSRTRNSSVSGALAVMSFLTLALVQQRALHGLGGPLCLVCLGPCRLFWYDTERSKGKKRETLWAKELDNGISWEIVKTDYLLL